MALSGMAEVLQNIRKAVDDVNKRATKGVIKAGALIRREGQIETPVDQGNLVNSWYGPDVQQGSNGPVAEIGLTSNYAVFVHENVEANFQKPGSKAKFLEDPLKRNEKNIAEIIAQESKIP